MPTGSGGDWVASVGTSVRRLPWERVSTGNTQWQAEEKARAAVHGRSGQILVLSEADSRHTASYPK